MEARDYAEYTEQVEYDDQIQSQSYVQTYVSEYKEFVSSEKEQLKKQQQEVSFFAHLSLYSLLVTLFLSLSVAVFPIIVAVPIGLLLPIGIILGSKKLWRMFLKK